MKSAEFIINDGVLEEYRGNSREVVIPEGVTEIGQYVFYHCQTIETLVIPEGVVSIERNAFDSCEHLKEISFPSSLRKVAMTAFQFTPWYIAQRESNPFIIVGHILLLADVKDTGIIVPEGVISIGEHAFGFSAQTVEEVVLPDTVTEIHCGAFGCCEKLNYISLPESLRRIGDNAFADCHALKEIELPEHLETIESLAFAHSGLEYVKLPASVEEIGSCVFFDCVLLKEIAVSEQNPAYTSRNGILYDKHLTTVICCPRQAEDFSLPESVTVIGNNAFHGCEYLKSFSVPETVTEIGSSAFMNCENLERILIPDSVVSIGKWCAHACMNLKEITYHGVSFVPDITEDMRTDEITKVFRMIDNNDMTVNISKTVKFSAVWGMFMKQPDNVQILNFIKSNFRKMFQTLLDENRPQIVQKVLACTDFITKKNIDELISSAIEQRTLEIQVMLMNYKNETIGYEDDETIIRKKFRL